MDTALPLPTQILITSSTIVQKYWFLLLLLFPGYYAASQHIRKNEKLMERFDEAKLKLPLVGPLLLKLAVARFSRTLGTLLTGGVSLFKALGIVRTIINNRYLARLVDDVKIKVGEGGSLTTHLRETGIFPPVFLHMIGVGEETGELESMMLRVADTYESEVDQSVTAMTSLLEPIMILIMGLVVGIIVIAILLPIFEMSQVIR